MVPFNVCNAKRAGLNCLSLSLRQKVSDVRFLRLSPFGLKFLVKIYSSSFLLIHYVSDSSYIKGVTHVEVSSFTGFVENTVVYLICHTIIYQELSMQFPSKGSSAYLPSLKGSLCF